MTRRTCARLCHESGGELEQIQFLLDHVSVKTTERYLGCKQKLQNAVNDRLSKAPMAPISVASSPVGVSGAGARNRIRKPEK
jgi:integrase